MTLFQIELGNGQKPVELEGWAALDGMYDAVAKQTAEQFKDHLELAGYYRHAMATATGRLMLEDLVRTFFLQRIVRPGDDQFAAGIRQGQADVVRRIVSMIEFANTGGGRVTGAASTEGPGT